MSEWIYFIHAPRENFAATMTDEEKAHWAEHFVRFQRLLAQGVIVLVGPTLGPVNTGIAIFEAPDEPAAPRIMNEDGHRGWVRPRRAPAVPRLAPTRAGSRYTLSLAGAEIPRAKSAGVISA